MKNLIIILFLIPIHLFSQDNSVTGTYRFGQDINKEDIGDYPNNSLWDFMGIWDFGQLSETLNISKDLSSNKVVVQYNSNSDRYEDRFFDNCYFKNGIIYGDFWGGKENVKLEIEEGSLLLTIDPFHEFQPLKKQLFKKHIKSIYKYCSQKNNTFIIDGNKKIDSLPPGDRVLVSYSGEKKNYFPTIYYKNRFNKTRTTEKGNKQIQATQLSDIKPLFVSENINLKYYNNLNASERYLKKIHTSEKLKENISIVTLPEQNVVGQKKLLVDKEIYTKLYLKKISPYKNDIFITGTVDLSKNQLTLVVDYQYDNEYETYLINYDLKGNYIDHILIGRNDYVESFTPIKSIFAPGVVYVNSKVFQSDGSEFGTYKTYESKRYIINKKGYFLESNYSNSYLQSVQKSVNVLTQQIESKTYGKADISLYLNYRDTTTGGNVTSMTTIINSENGMEVSIPMDLTSVYGFYSPFYGDFIRPHQSQTQETLFYTNLCKGDLNKLKINSYLKDLNNNGVEELIMEIIDRNYVFEPKEYFLFVNEGGSWVYSGINTIANNIIREYNLPFEMVFEAYLKTGYAPCHLSIENTEKQSLLLKENEELIYTFKIKNSIKRVTLGIDRNNKYIFYRFGKVGNIELEFMDKLNSSLKNFRYNKVDFSSNPPRDELEHVSFVNNDYQYALYNNYLETNINKYDNILTKHPTENYNQVIKELYAENSMSEGDLHELSYIIHDLKISPEIPEKHGVGIMIRNIKTNKKTFIPADKKTVKGFLGLIKLNYNKY